MQGILESIGKIEAKGYQLLQELRGSKLTKVYTAGGVAKLKKAILRPFILPDDMIVKRAIALFTDQIGKFPL